MRWDGTRRSLTDWLCVPLLCSLSLRCCSGFRLSWILGALLFVLALSWVGVLFHYFSSHGSAPGAHDAFGFSGAGGSGSSSSDAQTPRTPSGPTTTQVAAVAQQPLPCVPAPVPAAAPATSASAASHPYANCRPGSQRCVAWSTATPYSRFPLLGGSGQPTEASEAAASATAVDSASRGNTAQMPSLLSSASGAVSAAPYDIDGTPALRARLREYVQQHQAAHGLAAAAAEVERASLAAPGASALTPAALRASQHALWTRWVSSQRLLLHVDGESGLGNKLLPIVSAFAFALLTKRTLLLFFTVPGMDELFDLGPSAPAADAGAAGAEGSNAPVPLLESRWNVWISQLIEYSRRFDPAYDLVSAAQDGSNALHWSSRMEARLAVSDAKSRVGWRNFKEVVELFPSDFGPALALDLQSPDSTKPKANLLCANWVSDPAWTGSWLVYTWSDQYWLPLLAGNEWTRPQLLLWVNENNMYGPLSRFALNWSGPLVRVRADQFAREHFSSYNIGLQLRRKERLALKRAEVLAVVEGAKQLAMLHQADSAEMQLTPTAERAAQLRQNPNGPSGTAGMRLAAGAASSSKPRVTFFIASDDFASRPALAALLAPWGHVAFAAEVHYPRDERTSGSGYYVPPNRGAGAGADAAAKYKEGLQWAVVENLLLSACDDVILSPSSTYGYHAAGYSSLVPHRVLYEPASAPPVVRLLSAEPSAHFWRPLFREVALMQLCRLEADLPAQMQQEECCPRWTNGEGA